MQKKGILWSLLIAFVLLVEHNVSVQAASAELPEDCIGAPDSSCQAFAGLKILVTGSSCHGKASADCSAVRSSKKDIKEAFAAWFGDEKTMCKDEKVEVVAKAVATGIATVWADAAAKVVCEGMGFACGWSISDGNTFAAGFAETIAQAAAEAGAGGVAESLCFADIRAVSPELVTAATQASSDVCTVGGSAESFQDSYVSSVHMEIAKALTVATATICSEVDGEIAARSQCAGNAESTQENQIIRYGDVCGGLEYDVACSGEVNTTCCSPEFTQKICTCNKCNGPWIERSKKPSVKKAFANRTGDTCVCPGTTDTISNEPSSA